MRESREWKVWAWGLMGCVVSSGAWASMADPAALAPMARGHSHNDYWRTRPLQDALDNGYFSVEADVFLRKGRIVVSHSMFSNHGTLEDLYLEPLQAIVDRQGFVQQEGVPFYLWVDVKETNPAVVPKLHETLSRYPMLTRFTDRQERPGPVTVILTGESRAKIDLVNGYAERPATRDATRFLEGDPKGSHRWSWYALKWKDWMGEDPARLGELVRRIHAKRRRVRLFAVPGNERAWAKAWGAGVDQIGTDDLGRMRRFIFDVSSR